jgi:hypothetical protein
MHDNCIALSCVTYPRFIFILGVLKLLLCRADGYMSDESLCTDYRTNMMQDPETSACEWFQQEGPALCDTPFHILQVDEADVPPSTPIEVQQHVNECEEWRLSYVEGVIDRRGIVSSC